MQYKTVRFTLYVRKGNYKSAREYAGRVKLLSLLIVL